MKNEPKVEILSEIDGYVDSYTQKNVSYLVWFSNGKWTCDCLDFIYRGFKPDFEECKHIKRFKEELKAFNNKNKSI